MKSIYNILIFALAIFFGCFILIILDLPNDSTGIPADVYQKIKKNSVRLKLPNGGSCSATVVSNAIAVTAAHCLPEKEEPVSIADILNNVADVPQYMLLGRNNQVAVISHAYGQLDTAVIKGNFTGYGNITVDILNGDLYTVKEAILCGYPAFNEELRCVRARRVSNSHFDALFDTVGIPGQSGGGVFDMEGRLIGVLRGVTEEGYTAVGPTTGTMSQDVVWPK